MPLSPANTITIPPQQFSSKEIVGAGYIYSNEAGSTHQNIAVSYQVTDLVSNTTCEIAETWHYTLS